MKSEKLEKKHYILRLHTRMSYHNRCRISGMIQWRLFVLSCRDQRTKRDDFVFYSKRLMRIVIEYALSFLPFKVKHFTLLLVEFSTQTTCSYHKFLSFYNEIGRRNSFSCCSCQVTLCLWFGRKCLEKMVPLSRCKRLYGLYILYSVVCAYKIDRGCLP